MKRVTPGATALSQLNNLLLSLSDQNGECGFGSLNRPVERIALQNLTAAFANQAKKFAPSQRLATQTRRDCR